MFSICQLSCWESYCDRTVAKPWRLVAVNYWIYVRVSRCLDWLLHNLMHVIKCSYFYICLWRYFQHGFGFSNSLSLACPRYIIERVNSLHVFLITCRLYIVLSNCATAIDIRDMYFPKWQYHRNMKQFLPDLAEYKKLSRTALWFFS